MATARRGTATRRPAAKKAAPAKKATPAARRTDVTVYATKAATDYHKAFARWIAQEVGYDPDSAPSKRAAFLRGVSIATAARPAFMESDFLDEWRAKSGVAKRGPKRAEEVDEEEAPRTRRPATRATKRVSGTAKARRAPEPEEEIDEFGPADEEEIDEFDAEDEYEDDADEFGDEDEDTEEDDEDDEDDEYEDDEDEDEEAPPVRRRVAKKAPARKAPARRVPAKKAAAKKAAPARRRAAADDDEFLF